METQTTPVHEFGDFMPLQWPAGAPVLFRVETWGGSYVATYQSERDAHIAAKAAGGMYDAKVSPIYLTA